MEKTKVIINGEILEGILDSKKLIFTTDSHVYYLRALPDRPIKPYEALKTVRIK